MSPVAAPWRAIPVVITQGGSTLDQGTQQLVHNLAVALSLVRAECDAGETLWAELRAVLEASRSGAYVWELGEGEDGAGLDAVRLVLSQG